MTEDNPSISKWSMGKPNYVLAKHLPGVKFSQAIERVTAALKDQGFGVLTTIDIADTMKNKLDADMPPYVILGACNPKLALQALQMEPGIGALLPCNVVIAQEPEGVFVGSVDPVKMFETVENDEMRPVAEDVKQRLQKALDGLEVSG